MFYISGVILTLIIGFVAFGYLYHSGEEVTGNDVLNLIAASLFSWGVVLALAVFLLFHSMDKFGKIKFKRRKDVYSKSNNNNSR